VVREKREKREEREEREEGTCMCLIFEGLLCSLAFLRRSISSALLRWIQTGGIPSKGCKTKAK
jgi:hypothetical protein